MHKILLCLFVLALSNSMKAQVVEVLRKTEYVSPKKVVNFEFIEPKTNLSPFTFIATIKASNKSYASIPKLFFDLKYKAYQLHANCFAIKGYDRNSSTQETFLTLDVYYGNDSILEINGSNHVKNTIYVFGDDKASDERFNFYIDNMEKEIGSGAYYQYSIKKDKTIQLSQGRFLANTMNFKWAKDKPSYFLSLTKFGLAPNKESTEYLSKFFNTQTLNFIDKDLGHLLIHILKKSE